MKKISSKNKILLLKMAGVILNFLAILGVTSLFILLRVDKLWDEIPLKGITSFAQWSTLITYRFLIYVSPALLLSFVKFDKRYKWLTRFIIWLNWTLFIYLLSNAFIKVLSLDLVLKLTIFNSLDNVVLLLGYVITFFNKKKVEFDSTGAIIGELKE